MTTQQRWVLLAGVAAILLTLTHAPFRFAGSTGIGSSSLPVRGLAYRAVFDPPKNNAVDFLPVGSDPQTLVFVSDVQLDSGQIGLWWGGIVIATAAAVLLLHGQRGQASASPPRT